MFHGYCIRRAGDSGPAENLKGVGAGPVLLVENDALGIWLSETAAESPPSAERLREHERVVRAALRTATPLPLRYGSTFRAKSDAAAALAERRAEFVETLDRVAGKVEMGIRVALVSGSLEGPVKSPNVMTAAASGRAYLERRRQEMKKEADVLQRADAVLAGLEADLADLEAPAARTSAPHGHFIGSLAHLVHRGEVRRYGARMVRLQDERRDLQITISGPWAPYSFV